MLAVKLALALSLLKSEPILPSSRLPEWLQVLEVWCFRSLNNLLLFVMYYLYFWTWFCRLISMSALFLGDACSGGSSGPSPVGNISCGFWLCCWAWHGQLSTPLQEDWGENIYSKEVRICHSASIIVWSCLNTSQACYLLRPWDPGNAAVVARSESYGIVANAIVSVKCVQ